MTNSIGNFIKSVFPSSVDRNGEVFKALLADGSGGGTIEKIFEDLEETRSAWQDALNAWSLLDEQNEKLFGLISLLSQSDVSSESAYIARNRLLFDGARTGRIPWGSAYDVKELFKEFFETEDVWLANNCAALSESLLADGDFENEQEAWSLSGAEFYREHSFSGNISVLFEKGGILRQSVSITEAGAYFLNFFLQGSAKARVRNSAGQYWQATENGTGEWQAADAYWEFESASWDNKQLFFVLDSADAVTIEIEAAGEGTLVDYARLHLKTATSMFAVIAGFGGGMSSSETGSYAPPRHARAGMAIAGKGKTWTREDDLVDADLAYAGSAAAGTHRAWMRLPEISYEKMSYMDNAYVFGPSGMKAQEAANAFLEIVKPAGVAGYVEILTAETEVGAVEDGGEAWG